MAKELNHRRRKTQKKVELGRLVKVFGKRIEPIFDLFDYFQQTSNDRFDILEKQQRRFLKKRLISSKSKIAQLQIKHPREFSALIMAKKELDVLRYSRDRIPSAFLSLLLEEFESYLLYVIRFYIRNTPSELIGSEKQVPYHILFKARNIESIRNQIFLSEAKNVLDDGWQGVTRWLSKRDISLGSYINEIWRLPEIFARRNIHVHNEGRVDEEYLRIARACSFPNLSKLKAGERLSITREYLLESLTTLTEAGIVTGILLWKKMFPKERRRQIEVLYDLGYKFLLDKKYDCAKKILSFSLKPSIGGNKVNEIIRVNTINLGAAHLLSGNWEACKRSITDLRKKKLNDRFLFAIAVLERKYTAAAELMLKIGKEGSISRSDYHDWPMLEQFRNTKIFRKTYKNIFGDSYSFRSKFTSRVFSIVK